jgi:plastocyanin
MNKTTVFLTVTGLAAALQCAAAGEITGAIMLKGTPPPEKEIDKAADAHCGAKGTTHHYVVGSKGELANVVVFLEGVSGKSTGPSAPPVVLDQKGCEYTPSIFAVQTGQKITIKNSDPTLHNVHTQPADTSGNKEVNEAQTPNGPDKTYVAAKPEMFLKFKCDVHPWMFAWVSVFDHPYFAVSGAEGTYKIENVPAGKYKLQAAHRKAGTATQEIEVKEGAPTKADFTLEAK